MEDTDRKEPSGDSDQPPSEPSSSRSAAPKPKTRKRGYECCGEIFGNKNKLYMHGVKEHNYQLPFHFCTTKHQWRVILDRMLIHGEQLAVEDRHPRKKKEPLNGKFVKTIHYKCHRDGVHRLQTSAKTSQEYAARGGRKIKHNLSAQNHRCPFHARVTYGVTHENGKEVAVDPLSVRFFPHHSHSTTTQRDFDLLSPLPKGLRLLVKRLRALGISVEQLHEIMSGVWESISQDFRLNLSHDRAFTRKHIADMCRDVRPTNSAPLSSLPQDEALELVINDLKEHNSIVFHHKKGEPVDQELLKKLSSPPPSSEEGKESDAYTFQLEEGCLLQEEELLILQTPLQNELMAEYGSDYIELESSALRVSDSEDVLLTVVTVAGPNEVGVPVAWIISDRESVDMYKVAFAALKSRLPADFAPRALMTNGRHEAFDAIDFVYGEGRVKHWRCLGYCFHHWDTKLALDTSADFRNALFRLTLSTSDIPQFEEELTALENEYKEAQPAFFNFFNSTEGNEPFRKADRETWALAYRIHAKYPHGKPKSYATTIAHCEEFNRLFRDVLQHRGPLGGMYDLLLELVLYEHRAALKFGDVMWRKLILPREPELRPLPLAGLLASGMMEEPSTSVVAFDRIRRLDPLDGGGAGAAAASSASEQKGEEGGSSGRQAAALPLSGSDLMDEISRLAVLDAARAALAATTREAMATQDSPWNSLVRRLASITERGVEIARKQRGEDQSGDSGLSPVFKLLDRIDRELTFLENQQLQSQLSRSTEPPAAESEAQDTAEAQPSQDEEAPSQVESTQPAAPPSSEGTSENAPSSDEQSNGSAKRRRI